MLRAQSLSTSSFCLNFSSSSRKLKQWRQSVEFGDFDVYDFIFMGSEQHFDVYDFNFMGSEQHLLAVHLIICGDGIMFWCTERLKHVKSHISPH